MKLNDALSRITWQDFEILVANRYRRHGWEVAHCGDGRPGCRAESEVDLRMKRDREIALVQCRHESLVRLDAKTIERFLATAAEERASQVIVIASGEVPDEARQLAESAGARIIEGAAVREMLDDDLLDVRPAPMVAVADVERRRADMIAQEKMPRLPRPAWGLPLFFAALIALGLVAIYGATFARSRMEQPVPPRVDPAVLANPKKG